MPNPQPSPGFQIGGVDASIYVGENGDEGGIVETWTDKGLEVSVDFIVGWQDRIKFLQGLRGAATWDGGSPGSVTRSYPFSLPFNDNDTYPDFGNLQGAPYGWGRYLCFGTSPFRPIKYRTDKDGSFAGLAGWGHYDDVVIQAHFSSPSYFVFDQKIPYTTGFDISGYPYTTTTTRATGEVFAPYTNSFKFDATNVPINEANVGIIRPKTEIMITRHYMPMVDTLTYDGLIGKVNKDPITLGTIEYGEEAILYLSYEVEPYGDVSTGLTYYDIKHQLMANGNVLDSANAPISSWNYFLTPKGNWDKLVAVNGGATPYQKADFPAALWPDYP